MSVTRKLLYKTGANLIFLVHLTLVIIVSLGWLIPSFFYAFLFLLTATVLSEVFLGYCFLTRWEFGLRSKVNPLLKFDSSCIFHYTRALFGLKPRIPQDKTNEGFLKKYSSLLVLLIPLFGSLVINYFY